MNRDNRHVSAEEADRATSRALLGPAPASPSPAGFIARYPVAAAFLLVVLAPLASLLQALIDGEPVRAGLSALVAAAFTWLAGHVQAAVTPVADAKLGPGLPLVLDPASAPSAPPESLLPASEGQDGP